MAKKVCFFIVGTAPEHAVNDHPDSEISMLRPSAHDGLQEKTP
jgi:hypothetical protein